ERIQPNTRVQIFIKQKLCITERTSAGGCCWLLLTTHLSLISPVKPLRNIRSCRTIILHLMTDICWLPGGQGPWNNIGNPSGPPNVLSPALNDLTLRNSSSSSSLSSKPP
ncbi:hypothetical protein ILYODFUR_028556, partial [Ilyodon furcidens]